MKASELDALFDDNKVDVLQHFDTSKPLRPNKHKRVNVDFPEWMVQSLDRHARKIGVSRQALIKLWMADKLTETVRHEGG